MSEAPLAESQRRAINESAQPYVSACCHAVSHFCWSYSLDEYPAEIDVDCARCGRIAVHEHDPDAPDATESTEVYRRV